jgi:hypothetical protein
MYNLSKTEFESLVQKLILEENFEVLLPRVPRETQRRVSMFMCPSCPHE